MGIRVTGILILEGLFALFLLARAGLLRGRGRLIGAALLTAAAIAGRSAVFFYESWDFSSFLSLWTAHYRDFGGFAALADSVGNYNIPYLYFLAAFSYIPSRDLYLIKALSVFFDVVLAWASMMTVGLFRKDDRLRLGCFFAVLFLPTVFINGAFWAQCDSIYVAFAVLGLYLALSDRPVLSMACAAVSFGFKLQAVFLLPVFAVLWFHGKYRLRHFLVFPLTYVLLILPAVLLGRPFMDTLTLYFNQAGTVGEALSYDSASVFSLFLQASHPELASRLGILAAFCFTLGLLGLCWFFRRRLTDRSVLGAAALFAIGIPYLLPHMHERYFYPADIVSLILAFTDRRFLPAAVLVECASLICYCDYFDLYEFPLQLGGIVNAAALLWLICNLILRERQEARESGLLSGAPD